MDDEAAIAAEQQEVKNPFPTPPAYWTRYTPENTRLLNVLKEKLAERNLTGKESIILEEEPIDQESILPDETLLPSFPLLELEPPRLDWVLEQEEYMSFGEAYPTNETAQIFPPGIDRLYNPKPGEDPRPHLRQLLVSLLNAYHKLLADVLEPVPSGYHRPPTPPPMDRPPTEQELPEWPPPLNWEATILWIRTLILNLGWAVNEFRPIQARMALESMMQRQIDVRREEAKNIHGKCDELERILAELRTNTSALLPSELPPPTLAKEATAAQEKSAIDSKSPNFPTLTLDDVINWSQEVDV